MNKLILIISFLVLFFCTKTYCSNELPVERIQTNGAIYCVPQNTFINIRESVCCNIPVQKEPCLSAANSILESEEFLASSIITNGFLHKNLNDSRSQTPIMCHWFMPIIISSKR